MYILIEIVLKVVQKVVLKYIFDSFQIVSNMILVTVLILIMNPMENCWVHNQKKIVTTIIFLRGWHLSTS